MAGGDPIHLTGEYAIVQGDDRVVIIGPIEDEAGDLFDLTGYTFTAQIRRDARDSAAMATFAVTVDIPAAEVTLRLTDTQTRAMTPCHAEWDLQTEVGGILDTWFVGSTVEIKPDATRPDPGP